MSSNETSKIEMMYHGIAEYFNRITTNVNNDLIFQ